MAYIPQYTVSPALLRWVETITSLREKIGAATINLAWIAALQKDMRGRNAHASTAIEGNPLTLAEVRALEEGNEPPGAEPRARREVTNYFAALRYVVKQVKTETIRHDDIFALHRILAGGVMDQGKAGRYRDTSVSVGGYLPPSALKVSGLMFELLQWWNRQAVELSPILSSAILHYRFEAIHPFADGNGRAGRALALWELYRRGFDTNHIFSVDEYYWEDRPRYYQQLAAVSGAGEDLSAWLEYCAEGLGQTLERVWKRVQSLRQESKKKLLLRPRQEQLLQLLRRHGPMAPTEIWTQLDISKQGAMNLLNPLLRQRLVRRLGNRKARRYALTETLGLS